MADVLIMVLDQLNSLAFQQLEQKVRLVWGVKKEVGKLTGNLQAIRVVLLDAEKRQVKEETVRHWVDKLKEVSFDIDDVLDEWNTAILRLELGEKNGESAFFVKRVCFFIPFSWFPCLQIHQVSLRHDIACKIKDLNVKLTDIAVRKSSYNFNTASVIEQPEQRKTTSFVDFSIVYGRDVEKEALISKLLCQSSADGSELIIIPVVGMGGIGKTTLAQLVYNDNKVKAHFEKRIWLCVSDIFDEIRIAKAIIEALEDCAPNLVEMESLLQRVHKSIEGTRFLLVLDDVWTEDATKWEPFKEALKNGAAGSRILVTTRKKEVAIMMGAETRMIPIEVLSEEVCWSIFSQLAFFERDRVFCEQLEETGKKIVIKCKGIPLVAKTLGSLMHFKKSRQQWEDVLDNELWELEDVQMKVFVPFFLSYDDLSPLEKRCLSYCSIFPKNYEISREDLIEMWMSQGYLNLNKDLESQNKDLERGGQDCFENLAMRSFFQNFMKDYDGNIITCKMHDIMHDFIKFLTRKECCITEVCGMEEKTDRSSEERRHSTLSLEYQAEIPSSVYNDRKLRTLFVMLSRWSTTTFRCDPIFNLTCLRSLILYCCGLRQLPKEIGNLIHLRFLNVTGNSFLKEFPDTLCDLLNLQTLKMNECISFERLPKRIEKLVKLRHLYIFGCECLKGLPKGIEKLTCLRKLDTFFVPYQDFEADEALKLEDLNRLKHLQWSNVVVFRCANLTNGGQAEGELLKKKQDLVDLKLVFEWPQKQYQRSDEDEVILEALHPHPNLKSLEIGSYRGANISPSWLNTLCNLKMLKLKYCDFCEFLPPLGKLPLLEFLYVEYMHTVEHIGLEFLGVETDKNEAAKRDRISFPNLKELHFDNLATWKEWEGIAVIGSEEEEGSYCSTAIMPCLQSLDISFCNNLKALPDFLRATPLQNLTINCSRIVQERCREKVGEDWHKICHIPNINTFNSLEEEVETFSDDLDSETLEDDEISPANDEQLQEHQAM